MRYPDLQFVDFARGDVSRRNNVVPIRTALNDNRLRPVANSYITVFRFPEAYRERALNSGVGGYTGECFADYLPIDIDRKDDLPAALGSARKLAYTLTEFFDVDPRQIRYFFSGAKGFHLLIPTLLFGQIEPSPMLPGAFRETALHLASVAGEQIDSAIYDVNRLFRLPNSQHAGSGLWKIELSHDELTELDVGRIQYLAQIGPRDFRWEPPYLEPNDLLADLFGKSLRAAAEKRSRPASGSAPSSDLAGALEPHYQPGSRHELILAFAAYAAKRHMPREQALGVVEAVAAGDDELPDRLRAVEDTYDRVRSGAQVRGYQDLQRIIPESDLAAIRGFLGDVPPSRNGNGSAPPPEQEQSRATTFDAIRIDVLDRMAAEKRAPITAVPTMWPTWNHHCRGAGGGVGIARGWHVIVGARSGSGKSLVGANVAAHAIQHGEKCAIVSLEMSQIEMVTRVMAIVGRVAIRDLEHGAEFRDEAWATAARRIAECDEAGGTLFVNRETIRELPDIERAMRHLHEQSGVGVFIVDYLQLAGIGRASEILDRVTEISGVVRGLAKELKVVTIGMSQLNRQASAAKEKPQKEGLMGGSPLENDAEQVLLLDHSRVERSIISEADRVLGRSAGILSWAILDKNRHGPLAEIPTRLDTRTLEMSELKAGERTAGEGR